jgi:hypothetical protein
VELVGGGGPVGRGGGGGVKSLSTRLVRPIGGFKN